MSPRKKHVQIYVYVDPNVAFKISNTNVGKILKKYKFDDFTDTEKEILANALFSKRRQIFDISRFMYQGQKFNPLPIPNNSLANVKKVLADYKEQIEYFWMQRTDKQYLRYSITKVEKLLHQILPYDEEITNIEIDEQTALYFTWRDNEYRVTTDLIVKEIQVFDNDEDNLIENKVTLLIEQLLRQHKANVTK